MLRNLRLVSLLLFFAILAGTASAQSTPELRGIWVDTWGTGFKSAAQIDQLILDAQRGNLNAIFPQVRRRGDAFYNSTIEPKNTSVSPQSFDPLAYLIQKAHAANPRIEVHAWIITYPVGSTHSNPTHVLNKHPDWIMQDRNGAALVSNEHWLDPSHPGAQQHITDVALDIISRYDVDGFQFDYIRYPTPQWGYNPVAVTRFNQRFNRSGLPSTGDSQWLQFRRDSVTELVRRIYLEAIAIKPHVKISTATIGQAPGITTTAQWPSSAAYSARLQDWRAWMEEGIVDINIPMLYFDQQQWPTAWSRWNTFAKNHKYNRHLAIGPAWYLNTVADSLQQIQDTRTTTHSGNRAEGVVGYNYATTNTQGVSRTTFLNTLSNPAGPFPQKVPVPVMPWKTSPTRGHAKGIVTAGDTGLPFDHATVTLTGPQTRTLRTDGNGFYGAVDLLPGTYTVTAAMPNAAYDPAVQQIAITAGQVTTTDFALEFAPVAEMVIDNLDATYAGSWTNGSNPSQFGSDYRVAWTVPPTGPPSSVATFAPNISIPGTYDIYTWYVAGSNRAPDAPYVITHSDGETTVHVNQRIGGGQWQLIASDIHFSLGTGGSVRIGNNASGDAVIADAVRFTLVEADPDPADFFEEPVIYAGTQSAVITWETVGSAVVQVEYGLTQLDTTLTRRTTIPTTEHSVTLESLQPNEQYHVRLHAHAATSSYASNWFTFETGTPVEVIVDNLDPGVAFTGTWDIGSSGNLYYGSNYNRSWASASGATATFTPDLPATGLYDVYTYYPHGGSWAYDAPHLIQGADGHETVLVDQRSNGGGWRLLASSKKFTAGTSGFLRITNPGSGVTMADAQRWVLRDSPPEHALTLVADGAGAIGRTPNTTTYAHGATVQLTATPEPGWIFSHWTGDIESDQNPASIRLYRDREVTAVFHPLFELTTEVSGEGTVAVTPEEPAHPAGTEVTVLATPAPGWTFLGWSGDAPAEENPALVWIDSDKTVTAHFGFSYDAWSEVAFTPAQREDPAFSGPQADPYGHGIPNILAFAFGMDVESPDRSRLPAVEVKDEEFLVSFHRLRHQAGIQYQVEISTDLVTWDPAAQLFTEKSVAPDPDGKTERVTLAADATLAEGARTFVRIQIE